MGVAARPSRRRSTILAAVVGIVLVATACNSARPVPSPSSRDVAVSTPLHRTGAPTATVPATATVAPTPRPTVPADFPLPAGAVPVAVPADGEILARWTVQLSGAAAYDHFVAALPGAGYAIEELIPGGTAAVIRLRGPGGASWLLILSGRDPLVIEIASS